SLGSLYCNTDRLKDGEEAFSQALKLRQQLARQYPDSLNCLSDLISTLDNLGKVYLRTGRLREAEESFRHGLRVSEQWDQEHPGKPPEVRHNLARAQQGLGLFFKKTRKWEDAEKCFRQASELFEHLVKEHPLNLEYRGDLASIDNMLGGLHRE